MGMIAVCSVPELMNMFIFFIITKGSTDVYVLFRLLDERTQRGEGERTQAGWPRVRRSRREPNH